MRVQLVKKRNLGYQTCKRKSNIISARPRTTAARKALCMIFILKQDMEQNLIEKNVTEYDLDQVFNSIFDLENYLQNELKNIHKIEMQLNGLTKTSHYIFSITNRAIALNRGFYQLAKANNYISGIPLIRLQVDNCLRLFAISIVENPSLFYDEVLKGTHIKNLKDNEGNKMTDKYLVKKISTLFPSYENLYEKTSAYIHFSNQHLFINNKVTEENEQSIILKTTVGKYDDLEVARKVDYCYNMYLAGKDLYKIIYSYRFEIEQILKEKNKIKPTHNKLGGL
jgi:hypothetical protein